MTQASATERGHLLFLTIHAEPSIPCMAMHLRDLGITADLQVFLYRNETRTSARTWILTQNRSYRAPEVRDAGCAGGCDGIVITIGARQKLALDVEGSRTVIWQSYCPAASC